MAVSANSYFSNSVVGQMNVGSDIDIYETSSTPKFAVGTGFQRADGNRYRYCQFGALSAVSMVVTTDNIESSTTSTAMSAQALSPTLYRLAGEYLDPNKTGSRYLQINHTGANLSVAAVTADVFAGGTIMFIGTLTASGYSYRIKGNSAAGTPAAGEFYIELYDRLLTPVDTTSSFVIQGSKYANVEPGGGVSTRWCLPAGFTTVGQTANNYGWVCTRGLTGAIQGTTVGTIGHFACMSTNTVGSIIVHNPAGAGPGSTPNFAIVGVLAQTYSASNYCIIDACLE